MFVGTVRSIPRIVALILALPHAASAQPTVPATPAAVPSAPTPAPAEASTPTARVEALAATAGTRYQEGKFQEAIKLYLQAYQIIPDPALLFNVAVIYDLQVRDPEVAIEYYRRFISAPGADPETVGKATQRLEDLKAQKAADAAAAATPAGAPGAQVQPEAPASRGLTIAGWSLVAGGGVIVGIGAVVGVMAESDEEKYISSGDRLEKRDLRDRGTQRALVADILFGTGLLAAGVGTAILLTGGSGDSAHPPHEIPQTRRLGWAPIPGGGSAALFSGEF